MFGPRRPHSKGFDSIANDTNEYDGQDEPQFEYDDQGHLKLARVRVYRKGISRPFIGVARWEEYVQKNKKGAVKRMWAERPHVMLSKCAEVNALKKGFPEDLAELDLRDDTAESDPHEREPLAAQPPAGGAQPTRQGPTAAELGAKIRGDDNARRPGSHPPTSAEMAQRAGQGLAEAALPRHHS